MFAQEVTIQPAVEADFPRLFEISATTHATNYTELIPNDYKKAFFKYYEKTLENYKRYTSSVQEKIRNRGYVLRKATFSNGITAGYLSGEVLEDTTFEIRSLFVDPRYQARGIGKELMAQIVREYGDKRMQLFVIEGNQGAISLYKKFGFNFTKHSSNKLFFGARLLHMSRA